MSRPPDGGVQVRVAQSGSTETNKFVTRSGWAHSPVVADNVAECGANVVRSLRESALSSPLPRTLTRNS